MPSDLTDNDDIKISYGETIAKPLGNEPIGEGKEKYVYLGEYISDEMKGKKCVIKKLKYKHAYDSECWKGERECNKLASELITKWNQFYKGTMKYYLIKPQLTITNSRKLIKIFKEKLNNFREYYKNRIKSYELNIKNLKKRLQNYMHNEMYLRILENMLEFVYKNEPKMKKNIKYANKEKAFIMVTLFMSNDENSEPKKRINKLC